MGLVLGAPKHEVLEALLSHSLGEGSDLIVFRNSPKLRVDTSEEGVIYLKAAEIKLVNYSWQNEVSRLIVKADRLFSIIVQDLPGEESFLYRGLLFGKVGLGSEVADLLEFCDLEFDDADEWFYPPGNASGFVVAGEGSCDLSANPRQRITFIRVFSERGNTSGNAAP